MLDEKNKTTAELVEAIFADVDAMNADKFVTHLTPDGRFQFGNGEPTIGRQATRDSVAGFFSSINGLRHQVIGIFQQENVITVELSIDYTRKDGKVVTLPCANIFRMEGPLVRDYRVFMDVTPIFA
jgi:ketosteroid isomerase-like protein